LSFTISRLQISSHFGKKSVSEAAFEPAGKRGTIRCSTSLRDSTELSPDLQSGHGSKEKNQNADGDERERSAREKLRCPIQALTAPGLHEGDQSQNEPDAITDHRDRDRGLRGPPCRGTGQRTAHQTETKKEKRRESNFAQMIHALVWSTANQADGQAIGSGQFELKII
jgi:hypothetical protein